MRYSRYILHYLCGELPADGMALTVEKATSETRFLAIA
jgi:hypothetical protein